MPVVQVNSLQTETNLLKEWIQGKLSYAKNGDAHTICPLQLYRWMEETKQFAPDDRMDGRPVIPCFVIKILSAVH